MKLTINEAYDRALGSLENKHLDEVVDRLMPVITLVSGTRNTWTRDEVKRELAGLVSALRLVEQNPQKYGESARNRVVRFGPIAVGKGMVDGENYEIFISAAELYGLRVLEGEWRKDMDEDRP